MKESRCVQAVTCDRCREDCWPEWTVRFAVVHASESLEIVLCDGCVDELGDELSRSREGNDR